MSRRILLLDNILCFLFLQVFIDQCQGRNIPAEANEDRLPLSFTKGLGSTNLFEQLVNGTSQPLNETQNLFQSSISCGASEFYVQINFNKPFRGVVYAYQSPPPPASVPGDDYNPLYYPVQVLDSCTLQGNGATVLYLQLSFLSECIEKLSHTGMSSPSPPQEMVAASIESESASSPPAAGSNPPSLSQSLHSSPLMYNLDLSNPLSKYNLDGFNFRRALNDNGDSMLHDSPANESTGNGELYQLSLYIQNDMQIEQKSDSKVTIQCTSLATKNIVFEQNLPKVNYTSRRVDQPTNHLSAPMARSIVPTVHLTVLERKVSNENGLTFENTSELIDSRIDILRGRIPHLKLIEAPVDIGDDVTIIIRAKQLDGMDTKISTCYAHDHDNTKRFALTDQEGCPLEPSIMSEFRVLQNLGMDTKVYHSTLSAFKFANSSHLHLDCTLLTCRGVCPKISCETSKRAHTTN